MSRFACRSRFFRAVAFAAILLASEAATSPLLAQTYPADTCMPRRDAIAAVANGKVVPLRQVRDTAEEAAKGEMINAELCMKGGQTIYVVTVLSTSGKVVYVSLNAASGQLLNLR